MASHRLFRSLACYLAIALAGFVLIMLSALLLLRFVNPPTTTFMVGHQITHGIDSVHHRWVALDKISRWMPQAAIASEDQRFLSHHGLDFDAIRQALDELRQGGELRGASTITQQTAKNLFLWSDRSYVRKLIEAGLAVTLDALWSKQRIMEVYLNVAEFGDGIYGVEAASQYYFGTSARYLSQEQSARLVAVLPSPKRLSAGNPSDYVRDRADWIRDQMVRVGDFPGR